MIPPGIPDFYTRQRVADAGRIAAHRSCLVRRRADRAGRGRGRRGVARRHPRARRPASSPGVRGHSNGTPTVGEHELSCRATDAAGNTQPLDPPWNFQGHGNNSVQRFSRHRSLTGGFHAAKPVSSGAVGAVAGAHRRAQIDAGEAGMNA